MMKATFKSIKQFQVLFRHFFSRLSYSDLLKFEDQQRESRVVMLVILAVAGLLVAGVVFEPFLLFGLSGLTPADLWRYESLSLTFTMAVAGMIAVANWDKLFLDRLDRIHFLPLPIGVRTLFWGKFTSLLAFAVAVATIANLFATLLAAAFPAELLKGLLIGGWAHYLANLLCCIFVFLFVALMRALVMIFFPPGLGRRVAVLAQILLLFIVLSPMVWFFMIHHSLASLKAHGSVLFTFYPPLWFSGVYNRVLGVPDMLLDNAARFGISAILILLAMYFLASPFCMKRIIGGVCLSPIRYKRSLRSSAGTKFFAAVFLSHPIQVAVFHFFWQTLRRSREHKLRLTLFLALPVSFLLGQFAHLYLQKGFSGGTREYFLISLPLLLHFFLIVGMRMTVAYPHTLPANFVFRISASEPLRHYMRGLRKALVGSVVLPPLLVSFPLYLFFWPLGQAVLYLLFSLSIAMLLLELCFFNFFHVPFAAEHVPGKFKLRYYWSVLFIGGYVYYSAFSALGNSLLRNPKQYPVIFLLAALFYSLLRLRRGDRMKGEQLVFEEEPEQAMITLGFD